MAAAAALALLLGAASLPVAAQQPRAAPAATAAPEYRLGSGDVVRINVYQNPDLTLETRITEAGIVSYPLLGAIRLGGQSVTAAEKQIADGLRNGNFVKQPQVTIVVLQVRGNQASVLGQVNRPGRYPIEVADMRLTDLLAMAGGAAANGADMVVVTGTRNGAPFRTEVDLPTVFAPGGSDQGHPDPERRQHLGRQAAPGLHLRRGAAPRPDAAGARHDGDAGAGHRRRPDAARHREGHPRAPQGRRRQGAGGAADDGRQGAGRRRRLRAREPVLTFGMKPPWGLGVDCRRLASRLGVARRAHCRVICPEQLTLLLLYGYDWPVATASSDAVRFW